MQQQQKLNDLLVREPKRTQHIVDILTTIKKGSLHLPDAVLEYSHRLLTKCRSAIRKEQPIYLEMYWTAASELNASRVNTESAFAKLRSYLGTTTFIQKLNALQVYLTSSENFAFVKNVYDGLIKQDYSDYEAKKRRLALIKFDNKIQEFVEQLNQYLTENPNDIESWQELACIYTEHLNLFKAAFCYQQLIVLNPKNDHYYVRLGEIYLSLGGISNLKIAKDYLCYVVGRDENNHRALWCLNRTLKYLVSDYQKNDSANLSTIRELYESTTSTLQLYYKQSNNKIKLNKFRF